MCASIFYSDCRYTFCILFSIDCPYSTLAHHNIHPVTYDTSDTREAWHLPSPITIILWNCSLFVKTTWLSIWPGHLLMVQLTVLLYIRTRFFPTSYIATYVVSKFTESESWLQKIWYSRLVMNLNLFVAHTDCVAVHCITYYSHFQGEAGCGANHLEDIGNENHEKNEEQKDNLRPCVIQYVMFPPHTTSSNSKERLVQWFTLCLLMFSFCVLICQIILPVIDYTDVLLTLKWKSGVCSCLYVYFL